MRFTNGETCYIFPSFDASELLFEFCQNRGRSRNVFLSRSVGAEKHRLFFFYNAKRITCLHSSVGNEMTWFSPGM